MSNLSKEEIDISVIIRCPLSGKYMKNPVVASDGYTYEKNELLEYLKFNTESPMDSSTLTFDFRENKTISKLTYFILSKCPDEYDWLYNENSIYENIIIDQEFIEHSGNDLLIRVLTHSKHIDNNIDGWNVYHLICAFSNKYVINYMLKNMKYDINKKTDYDETYLHLLCENEIIINDGLDELLVEHYNSFKTMIDMKDNKGNLPTSNYALYLNTIDSLKIFIDGKANIPELVITNLRKNRNIDTKDIEIFIEQHQVPEVTIQESYQLSINHNNKKKLLNVNDEPKKPKKKEFNEQELLNIDDEKLTTELLKTYLSESTKTYLRKNKVSNVSNMNKKQANKKAIEIIKRKKK